MGAGGVSLLLYHHPQVRSVTLNLVDWMGKAESTKKPGRDIPSERVKRECLACGRVFIAEGRFERLCINHRHGEVAKDLR